MFSLCWIVDGEKKNRSIIPSSYQPLLIPRLCGSSVSISGRYLWAQKAPGLLISTTSWSLITCSGLEGEWRIWSPKCWSILCPCLITWIPGPRILSPGVLDLATRPYPATASQEMITLLSDFPDPSCLSAGSLNNAHWVPFYSCCLSALGLPFAHTSIHRADTKGQALCWPSEIRTKPSALQERQAS